MELKTFKEIIGILKNQSKVQYQLCKLNIDLDIYSDPYDQVIEILIEDIYGKEGLDFFLWYVYELLDKDMSKDNPKAWDKDGNPICYDVKSLWEYLEKNKP